MAIKELHLPTFCKLYFLPRIIHNIMDKNLIVVGELHQDLFYRTKMFTELADLLAKALNEKKPSLTDTQTLTSFILKVLDESPKKINGEMYTKRGGNGNNSAEAMIKLNVPVKLMTTVGEGVNWMFEELEQLNINPELIFHQKAPTPISTIIEDPNITKILVAPNAKEKMNFNHVKFSKSMFEDSGIIFFTPMADKYTKVLEFINGMDIIKTFTLELQKITNFEQFKSVVSRKTDIMFANLNDAAMVVRGSNAVFDDTPEQRLKSVDAEFKSYSRVRVYTLGKYGSWICIGNDGKYEHTDVFNVKVVNRTGAGDTYAAGFLAYLYKNLQDSAQFIQMNDADLLKILKEASVFGSKAAAIKISTGSAPSYQEIQNFIV